MHFLQRQLLKKATQTSCLSQLSSFRFADQNASLGRSPATSNTTTPRQLALLFDECTELNKKNRLSVAAKTSVGSDQKALHTDMVSPRIIRGADQHRQISSYRNLSVIRERDVALSAGCAGRMTISGRMVDVCAELDRMVSAAHQVSHATTGSST